MTIISTGKLPTYDEEVAVRNQTDAMTPGWLATAITLCGEAQDATVRTYGKNEVNLFKPARHRVERAKVHSREMIECWNEFLEPHPFAAHLTRTNATEYILTVEQYEEFPQELPALFGEWLYNLRSALDYIIWAAAAYSSGRLPPPHEDRLQYPICDSENSWKRTSEKLSVLPQHQLELLRTMQPFASDVDANYLGWINRLARIDRHRRLTIWAARIVTADPIAHIPSGVEPRWEWGERMLESGYCDLARLTFPDSESAEGVSVNPRLTIDPEVSEWGKSPFYAERKFDERLRMFMVFVLAEIDTYDYDCTGNLEARRSLTEEFAIQCDERRDRFFKIPTHPPRSVPQWTPAKPHKSSRDRFLGKETSPDLNGHSSAHTYSPLEDTKQHNADTIINCQ